MNQFLLPSPAIWRASVIIAALLFLCVSRNVGPRFLPLPPPKAGAKARFHAPQDSTVLRHQANEQASFRVPMMARSHKRTDQKPQRRWLAEMPGADFVISNDFRMTSGVIVRKTFFISLRESAPSDRAPPELS